MANTIEPKDTISYIKLGEDEIYSIDAVTVGGKSAEDFQDKKIVTSISSASDDEHYPSAKCMWDIVGNIENILKGI